ncbi:MAG TPA: LamG-like jellyroll fold domain-containing protein [Abditibacteriaceae bacterium]|jgi:hypothetical protein
MKSFFKPLLPHLICLLTASLYHASAQQVPLVAHYPLESNTPLSSPLGQGGERGVLVDNGPLKLNGTIGTGTRFIPGKVGQALEFAGAGESRAWVNNVGLIGRLSNKITITAWVKVDDYAHAGGIIAKRAQNVAAPFSLSIGKEGQLGFEGNNGQGWDSLFTGPNIVPEGQWFHLAFVYDAGSEARFFVDAKLVGAKKMSRALASNDQDFVLGADPFRGAFKGALDEVKLFAAALNAEQIQNEANGQALPVRAAKNEDFSEPTHLVKMALVRFDQPIGFQEGYGRTRLTAQKVAGPDAVDWPQITLDGKPIFALSGEQDVDLPLRENGKERSLFQQPYDQIIEPGNHWVRAIQWMWGQRYAYTTDRTARTWHNDYELWAFPILIQGAGEADVKDVVLKYDGKIIYRNAGPLRSLTLLLPQGSMPYELSVAGRPFQQFAAGLSSNLRLSAWPVNIVLSGTPRITVTNAPPAFIHKKEWDEDLKAMREAKASGAMPPFQTSSSAARPPISVYAINPPHGMGGGAFFFGGEHLKKFEGSAAQYADYLANLGIDHVWEKQWNDEYARALAAKNIQFGYIPGTSWGRPFLAHPNLAFFAANLPDWHTPLYRDLQLHAQKLKAYRNFAGLSIGADNGGYVSFWDWAPPIPNRPWGEAFEQFRTTIPPLFPANYQFEPHNPDRAYGKGLIPSKQSNSPEVLLPKHMGGSIDVHEFLHYVAHYDETFKQYGYFANAVREVDPNLKFFNGSFGSSPGVGGRGGWPWASIPGAPMHENLSVMQAYDWNELSSSKPMHLVALIDRLKLYYPNKAAWALVDDFKLFFNREARQRAYALALTRGIDAIGTTFLAAPNGSEAKPQTIAEQKELFAWIHKHGSVYKGTKPLASVGVLYVHPQALLRRVNQDANAKDEVLLRGSHEGKTTEALWLCHAAGWPAKIITPEELKQSMLYRGLETEIKVILLTGLNRFDDSWLWSNDLEEELKSFVARGGKIILDDESVVPPGIAAAKTNLKIHSYVPQSDTDWTPKLFARNKSNIQLLRAAMQGVEKPIVTSDNPTIWAIPHQTGSNLYVTVVNWGHDESKNASQWVKPQTGSLKWNTKRPIQDLQGKKLTPQEAQKVDLTKNGMAVFVLPAESSGLRDEEAGVLSGNIKKISSTPLEKFAVRSHPLVIALIPEQKADAKMQSLAKKLSELYAKQGRKVEVRTLAPGDVVLSLQELNLQKLPRWKTIDADLVLLGNAQNNLLIFDQVRGGLLDATTSGAKVTYSPFSGEFQALNIVADDVDGLEKAIMQLTR